MKISKVLQINKGITSIIGAGGKTTLMLKFALELASCGRVIICTTTRIFPPENITLIASNEVEDIEEAFMKTNVISISMGKDESGKLMPPGKPVSELLEYADYVICEADGAKSLPLKAHNENEPVIPDESNQVIVVIGIDGIGKPVKDVCHRPEIYARFAGVDEDSIVTPQIAMQVINEEKLGTKILINKVENEAQLRTATEMSKYSTIPVIAGSLQKGEYVCL